MQVGGRENDEAVVCQVHYDRSGPLQKRVLQAIIKMHH